MPVLRLTVILAAIVSFVLLAFFVITKNKVYLDTIKRMGHYLFWFLIVVGLFYLISRVIRI